MSTPESKGGDSFYLDRMVRNFEWNIQHDPMNYKDSVKNQPFFIFLKNESLPGISIFNKITVQDSFCGSLRVT